MFGRLRNWWRKEQQAELRGSPPVRREKTYAADDGQVYNYYYEGFREARREAGDGLEYFFDVSHDRRERYRVSVFLPVAHVKAWQRSRDRKLNATEQYALAKMRLFQTFDEGAATAGDGADVILREEDLERHADALDF